MRGSIPSARTKQHSSISARMEPSWHVVRAGLGPLAPLSPALERAFAYERMRRSLWYFLSSPQGFLFSTLDDHLSAPFLEMHSLPEGFKTSRASNSQLFFRSKSMNADMGTLLRKLLRFIDAWISCVTLLSTKPPAGNVSESPPVVIADTATPAPATIPPPPTHFRSSISISDHAFLASGMTV
jgi:hypothetical protein